MKPKAKNLILDLLLAANGEPIEARQAVEAGALFNISENSIRVALVRLSSEGLIQAAARGSYQFGDAASDMARDMAMWRHADARIRPWSGAFVMVSCVSQGRSDRPGLRRRTRALDMLGFRELEQGLFVRPDNIDGGVAGVRKRLHTLGLESNAPVFLASDFDATHDALVQRLWDGKSLNGAYRRLRTQLEAWLERAEELELDVAAREAFLLGAKAIRQIVFDPLLPEPFVDAAERHRFIEVTRRFDEAGHDIWRRRFQFHGSGSAVEAKSLH